MMHQVEIKMETDDAAATAAAMLAQIKDEDMSSNPGSLDQDRGKHKGIPGTFWPERPQKIESVKANTVLTNLQRGNIPTMQTIVVEPVVASLHQRAGQGELKASEVNPSMVDERDHRQKTPLMWSAAYGQTPTVNRLLQNGATVNAIADESETALHLASSNGHHDVVKLLLGHGATVDALDENSCTSLMFASMQNHPHCVNELLLNGADVTRTNINGDTAVSLAVKARAQQAQAVLEQHIISCVKQAAGKG